MHDQYRKDPWVNKDKDESETTNKKESKTTNKKESKSSDKVKCSHCTFDSNEPGATTCEICFAPLMALVEMKQVNNLRLVKTSVQNLTSHTHTDTDKPRKSKKSSRKSRKVSKTLPRLLIQLKKGTKRKLFTFSSSLSPELKKPSNLIGIAVIGFGLTLWGNHLLTSPKTDQVKIEQKETTSLSAPVPSSSLRGLFNYGGAPFYAPLASNGLISTLESDNPGVQYRFAKPLNQDFGDTNGIKMLIEQKISVAFVGRSLTDPEFRRAKLRGFELVQLPIALDGVIFFGNEDTPVSSLNEQQITDIFTGKITNWNQISPNVKDLPITPIVLENEDLKEFGIELSQIPSTAQFVPNHTQAVRKVIATPGAISFSSASLAKDQELIQSFEIAEGDSTAYVPGLIDGLSNTEAFKDESYPYTRSIFLSHRVDGSFDEQAAKVMEDYLNSVPGQKLIEESGFVPFRS